jgi:hypothetical protein
MFRHGDGAVVKKIKITFTLKVKAIFNALFLFNKPFQGVLKVPNINIYGVRVLWLR